MPVLKFLGKIFEFCKRKSKVLENILTKKLSAGNKLLKKKGRVVYNNLYLSKKKALPICGGKAGKEPGSFESEGTEEKEKSFDQGRSYCLRSISPLFDDNNAGEHSRKEG